MYNAITIEVDNKNKLFSYFEDMCKKSKNLKNVSNFYIRQLMTGLKKEDSNKQENEKEVISIVEKSILKANSKKQENLIKRLEKLESSAFSLEKK